MHWTHEHLELKRTTERSVDEWEEAGRFPANRVMKLTAIGGGANEIMLQVIAKRMGMT